MKKSLLAVIAALAVAGCSQNDLIDEIDNGTQTGKTEIGFNTYVGKASRATALTDANFKSFQVYGYKSADAFNGTTTVLTSEYLNDEIKRADKDTDWAGTKTAYWPMTEKVHFFAYSPKDITEYNAATGYPTIAYTVPAVATQQDLVVANAIDKVKADDKVALAFKHALTQVNFSLKLANKDTKYTVTKITISGLKNQGTFTYNGVTDNLCGTWSNPQGDASYDYDFASNTITTEGVTTTEENEAKDLSADANALMLLPQDLSTAKVAVTYKAEIGGETTFDATKEVSLTTGTWAPGQKVRYTLELTNDAKPVGFTTTFAEWSEPTDNPVTPAVPTIE